MAKVMSPLLTRWVRGAPALNTGESDELDFDLAVDGGLEIQGVVYRLMTAAMTAVNQSIQILVTLDGAASANDAISTQALFEAREILDDTIFNAGHGIDSLTSGGGTTEVSGSWEPREPIVTARNPGVAALAIVSAGEYLVGIQYRLLRLTDAELVLQIARRRR